MAQGKEERLGLMECLRMEEKERIDSRKSPLRERSAMAEFQEWTLDLSMHLEKKTDRFGFAFGIAIGFAFGFGFGFEENGFRKKRIEGIGERGVGMKEEEKKVVFCFFKQL